MPAIKQSNQTAEGKGIPPVTHRAILSTGESKATRLPSAFAKRDWAKKVQQLKRDESKESNHHG